MKNEDLIPNQLEENVEEQQLNWLKPMNNSIRKLLITSGHRRHCKNQAKFNQLERRINLMIDLQIASELPIIK